MVIFSTLVAWLILGPFNASLMEVDGNRRFQGFPVRKLILVVAILSSLFRRGTEVDRVLIV